MSAAASLVDFLNASPTPWHAVATTAQKLLDAGFRELDIAGPPGRLVPGDLVFVRRSGTLLAARVGAKPATDGGFRVVSGHTDSPNLRVKPNPMMRDKGWVRLGVEVYGGVILATWADRDLGLAGQVVVRRPVGQETVLIRVKRPILRIPNLAIHLNRGVNDDGLKLNAQTQMPPVFALDDGENTDSLRAVLAAEIGCEPGDVLTWDLCCADLQPSTIGGLNDEFVFSGRLDNLGSCHAAVEAIVGLRGTTLPDSTGVIALFDHEEIGSTTSRGAQSRLLEGFLERLCADGPQGQGGLTRALMNSLHLSADMAHAVHPAHADKHEPNHMPQMNKGLVIKQNSSQRYGSEAETAARVVRICEAVGAPYQWFVNRTDLACGTTVGPLVAAQLGVPTCDVGNPMLSMHSAREMCGTKDQDAMIALMGAWLAGQG